MNLKPEEVRRANLAWIYDVYVYDGPMKDPGVTIFYKLQIGEVVAGVKPSRAPETKLVITVDGVNEDDLAAIKADLVNNLSLSESKKAIEGGKWLKGKIEITPAI